MKLKIVWDSERTEEIIKNLYSEDSEKQKTSREMFENWMSALITTSNKVFADGVIKKIKDKM